MRLADTVGLDVLAFISADLTRALDGREDFSLPRALQALLGRGDRGEKSGRGYYQRIKNADGTSTILALNLATLEYEGRSARVPELVEINKLKSAAERTRALLMLDTPAGDFTRRTIFEMLRFAAARFPEVANTVEDIDHALEWGFGWELGPFRLIDALGLDFVLAGFEKLGLAVPPLLQEGRKFYPGEAATEPEHGIILLKNWKRDAARTVRAWPGASLVDLGDGALLLEFTSKANALGTDAFAAVHTAITETVPGGFLGLVIGNQGRWFSAGGRSGRAARRRRSGPSCGRRGDDQRLPEHDDQPARRAVSGGGRRHSA